MAKAQRSPELLSEDRHLKRDLGFWHLTGVALGGVIGSGWLLAPVMAAHSDGPAAVLAWVIGAVALILMSMVLVELGASAPLSGGLVRWPFHTSGRVVGTFAAWSVWIAYAINAPSEASAALRYLPKSWNLFDDNDHLVLYGKLLGLLLMVGFVALNWFGVLLFARVNLAVTIGKVAVPSLTAGMLFWSGFHSGDITHHGVPGGDYSFVLPSVISTGIFFAYNGFQGPLDVAGEARNAKRDIPRAVATALLISTVLYITLQIAVLGAEPGRSLLRGWNGINANSTLVELATTVNLSWVAILLAVGAGVSTTGSAVVYTTESSRAIYAISLNRLIPEAIGKVHRGSGIPRRALAVNFALGAVALLILPEWKTMVTVSGMLTLFGYSLSLISEQAIRRARPSVMAGWVGGTRIIAPVSFVISTLLLYWASWKQLSHPRNQLDVDIVLAGLLVIAAVTWFRSRSRNVRELVTGSWIVVYLAALYGLALIGSSGAVVVIRRPWDSVLAGVIGLAGYLWGLTSATAHLREHPAEINQLLGRTDA